MFFRAPKNRLLLPAYLLLLPILIPIRQAAIWRARRHVANFLKGRGFPLHTHLQFDSTWIHPKHLAIEYVFETEEELRRARIEGLTQQAELLTRSCLLACHYPAEVIPLVKVGFASHEDAVRTADGNYFQYY